MKVFLSRIRDNAERGWKETVAKAEDRIYESVNKSAKINPLDYPQLIVNGICKILDKILDGINAVLRILFF